MELQEEPVDHTSESDLRFKAIERWCLHALERHVRRTEAAQAVARLAEKCGQPIPEDPP